jgi:two-component system NtrC family response regulator
MAEGNRLTMWDLELPNAPRHVPIGTTLKDARDQLEKEMVQSALRKHRGKIAPASLELGVSRPTLYDLMGKFSIARKEA